MVGASGLLPQEPTARTAAPHPAEPGTALQVEGLLQGRRQHGLQPAGAPPTDIYIRVDLPKQPPADDDDDCSSHLVCGKVWRPARGRADPLCSVLRVQERRARAVLPRRGHAREGRLPPVSPPCARSRPVVRGVAANLCSSPVKKMAVVGGSSSGWPGAIWARVATSCLPCVPHNPPGRAPPHPAGCSPIPPARPVLHRHIRRAWERPLAPLRRRTPRSPP